MPDEPLIISPLENAVASLQDVFAQPKTEYMRDASIQRFEYTFELAVKMIKRVLEAGPEGSTVDQLSYRDLVRAAAEAGLLSDPEAWFTFRDARNRTSHVYDETVADEVYAVAEKFLPAVTLLVQTLRSRV